MFLFSSYSSGPGTAINLMCVIECLESYFVPSIKAQSIVSSISVCLSICPTIYLKNQMPQPPNFQCTLSVAAGPDFSGRCCDMLYTSSVVDGVVFYM